MQAAEDEQQTLFCLPLFYTSIGDQFVFFLAIMMSKVAFMSLSAMLTTLSSRIVARQANFRLLVKVSMSHIWLANQLTVLQASSCPQP